MKEGKVIYTTPQELTRYFDDFRKNWTILDYLESFWYRYFWNFISEIPLNIKSSIQRGKRGWADSDTWDFDGYLTKIIIEGITYLKKEPIGYPNGVKNKQEWKKTLKEIIDGFKAYQDACDYTKINTKSKFNKRMKKFNKGMKLFVKYYSNLWD